MISVSLILASVSALLALSSSFYVFHRLLVSPALLHFTSFVGAILTLALSVISVLCSVSDIFRTFGVLGLAVYNVVGMVLDDSTVPNETLRKAEIYVALATGLVSLIYAAVPLKRMKKEKELKPERTAISIIRLLQVVAFFIAHFAIAVFSTQKQPFMDVKWDAIDYILLGFIFLFPLIPTPRGIVKRIKKRFLGVEELVIGGDFRPSMMVEQLNNPQQSNASMEKEIEMEIGSKMEEGRQDAGRTLGTREIVEMDIQGPFVVKWNNIKVEREENNDEVRESYGAYDRLLRPYFS
ncbi:3454_t:CDS:2 [Paraglomus occultum]|uniref:3454_t:CDS:1 n=1 Tax=Paraglomus occultum TaxID=144539 RepID=A0A9N9B9P1_9GLOM|nr:3454_t:CDS:2 [Paraglomus occultum]